MSAKSELLNELYQARFDGLKELAVTYQLPKNGSVETLRARLIQHLILEEWDLSPNGIKNLMNAEIGEILGVFGIKKSGSVRARRQRLYLHLKTQYRNGNHERHKLSCIEGENALHPLQKDNRELDLVLLQTIDQHIHCSH